MGHAVPVEHLLLLLRSDAIVLVHEVQERTFRLFQRRIGSGFEIAQVREYAFLEFLRVLHRSPEGLKAKRETPYDICSGDVEEIIPTPC